MASPPAGSAGRAVPQARRPQRDQPIPATQRERRRHSEDATTIPTTITTMTQPPHPDPHEDRSPPGQVPSASQGDQPPPTGQGDRQPPGAPNPPQGVTPNTGQAATQGRNDAAPSARRSETLAAAERAARAAEQAARASQQTAQQVSALVQQVSVLVQQLAQSGDQGAPTARGANPSPDARPAPAGQSAAPQPEPPAPDGAAPTSPPQQQGTEPSRSAPITDHASDAVATPDVDIYETPDELAVFCDLPGVRAEDIELAGDERRLRIAAERPPIEIETKRTPTQQERYRRAERTIQLPTDVRVEEAEATCEHGVCRVRLPKATHHDIGVH